MVVHEGVAGLGVLLDVVVYAHRGQAAAEPPPCAAQIRVLSAEAADDRARAFKELFGIGLLACRAIVHAGCVEPPARCQHQREPAAQAEADHTDPAGAVGAARQPGTHRLDLVERSPRPSACLTDDAPNAPPSATPGEEVGRGGQVARSRQPIRLPAKVMAHPDQIVKHDDAGEGTRAVRHRHVRRQPTVGTDDRRFGHRPSLPSTR